MSKKLIGLACALTLMLVQPGFACDQNNKPCDAAHHRFDKLEAALELTPEQKTKIKTYKKQTRASMKVNYAQLKALRSQISILVKSDKVDEAKLDSLIEQVNKIKGAMLKSRIMMQHEMYMLLTDKQKAKYQALKKIWEEKHH